MPRKPDLDWDDLRYFLRAAQAKSLAGAARSLGVEHSTVGRRLSVLERALGAPLLLRGPAGLQLTSVGEKLLPLIAQVDQAVTAVREHAQSEKAIVKLAVPSGFTPLFAAALRQPGADSHAFSLAILSGSRPVDLKRGEADLAIRVGTIADPELIASKLCPGGFSLYAALSYLARRPAPADVNDLSGHDVIGFDTSLAAAPPALALPPDSVRAAGARWLQERMAGANVVLRGRDMTDVLSAALSGVGLAVLPCLLGDAEPTLKRLTPQVIAAPDLSLVYRREVRISEPVREAIRFVRAVVRRHAPAIAGDGRVGGTVAS